jgi:biopolymer transport protein ExbB
MSFITRLRALTAALSLVATTVIFGASPALAQSFASGPSAASVTQTSTSQPAPTNIVANSAAASTVDNPYGLDALWHGGDAIARGTLLILAIMSMGSWYLIVTKFFEQSKLNRQAARADKILLSSSSVRQATTDLKDEGAFLFIATQGIRSTDSHPHGPHQHVDMSTWVSGALQRSIDTVQSRLQGGLAFLGTVGSTAPFVGLFGTVWGIYHALTAIGIAGQASIDKVAGPVGEALIMTAIGLAVAVPAVLGYNWLARRNKAAMERVRGFGADLQVMLLGGNHHASFEATDKPLARMSNAR